MSDMLTFYRGIAVARDKAEADVASIRSGGMRGDEGRWQFSLEALRDRTEALFQKEDLSTTDTQGADSSPYKAICACGDELGASYYALVHNVCMDSDERSYVIEFAAPADHVSIDGRDFLYTCFQLWDRESTDYYDAQCKALDHLFGSAILRYFQKAARSQDQQFRIAMCDLACQDPDVIRAHIKNTITIEGRYQVVFRSAFFVRVPIEASQILDIRPAKQHKYTAGITLDQFLKGRL
jgi:hypothetical protein